MTELIERLGSAPRGSRELTADIYEARGYRVKRAPGDRSKIAWKWFDEGTRRWVSMLDLSESVDDALTQIPKDWFVYNTRYSTGHVPRCEAFISDDIGNQFNGHANTLALAICIAWLRHELHKRCGGRPAPPAAGEAGDPLPGPARRAAPSGEESDS